MILDLFFGTSQKDANEAFYGQVSPLHQISLSLVVLLLADSLSTPSRSLFRPSTSFLAKFLLPKPYASPPFSVLSILADSDLYDRLRHCTRRSRTPNPSMNQDSPNQPTLSPKVNWAERLLLILLLEGPRPREERSERVCLMLEVREELLDIVERSSIGFLFFFFQSNCFAPLRFRPILFVPTVPTLSALYIETCSD